MNLRITLDVELDEKYTVPRPPISWRPQSYSLGEVLKNFELPQVVQCDVKQCPIAIENVNFDMTQPLLLCLNRTVRKICGRNLTIDRATKTLNEVGEPVLIPEDYKGWFAVIRGGGRVPHFGSISSIASSRVCRFLVTTKLVAFYIVSNNDGAMTYARRELLPGDVLRAGKVYVGSAKPGKDFTLFKKKKKKEVEVKFLKCTDDADREILINLNQTGTFYPISYTNGSSTGCVMQLTEVLKKLYFPLDVKLVYGRMPNAPCSFTGLLRLTASFEEDTVVASTILNYRNILLELSTQSFLLFKAAHKTRQMLESKAYQQALEMCQERAEVYVRDMKVSFDFVVEPAESNSTRGSFTDSRESSVGIQEPGDGSSRRPSKATGSDRPDMVTSSRTTDQDRYIDTSGANSISTDTSIVDQCSSETGDYDMIWLTSEKSDNSTTKVKIEPRRNSAARNSSFRLSLEGTYLSCPIFSTVAEDKIKSEVAHNAEKPLFETDNKSSSTSEAQRNNGPPPLPPRVPLKNETTIRAEVHHKEQHRICEVLRSTQPVERALQYNSTPSQSSDMSPSGDSDIPVLLDENCETDSGSISDSQSGDSMKIYENTEAKLIPNGSWLDLNDIDEDLRDYDFPEPYFLGKAREAEYSPIAAAPNCPQISPPGSELGTYYDSGSYRAVSSADCVDDLPLGASCSQIGGYCPQSGTSGHSTNANCVEPDKLSTVDSGVADGACGSPPLKVANGVSVLSVTEVAEALRRMGLKDNVVESFMNERIDGELLAKFDDSTLQETFPSLRSIEIRKICLFIQSGWQPNV